MVKQYIFGSVFAALAWALITTTTYAAEPPSKEELNDAYLKQQAIIMVAEACIREFSSVSFGYNSFMACEKMHILRRKHINSINLVFRKSFDFMSSKDQVQVDKELKQGLKQELGKWFTSHQLMTEKLKMADILTGSD